ncbi:peroxidase-related enzyme [Xylophilus sp.]|uniref:peroxidase-related enzyme n=1 Tax=Xylophilus sp. TaxID=2653893 RepID=UPI0013B8C589|nr:peroxidase-related enzyme [Xylophilus sp.]KAF1046189.1 MAG: hypothetical protein GAK38_02586 [Xylophilus sp.]
MTAASSIPSGAADGATPALDTLDQLAGLAAGSPAHAARHQRAKVAAATEACQQLFFGPGAAAGSGPTPAERLLVASDSAERLGLPRAAAHNLALYAAQEPVAEGPRRSAILGFARALADAPARADRSALAPLQDAAGLTVPDAVLLAQLIGYLACQLRTAAAWQALGAAGPGRAAPAAAEPEAPFVHPAHLPPPGQVLERNGFTNATLGWTAWLPVVDPATATPEQLAVLDASHPKARTSDFYLLLAHQPAVLAQRSQAFNAIMYAPGGLPRAERALVGTAVSVVNRCVFCAAVHAQRYEQLTGRNAVIAQLFDDVDTAGTDARERAIVQAAAALTRAPSAFGADAIHALRHAGLGDLEALDALHAAALFAWANRLILNLGEPHGV